MIVPVSTASTERRLFLFAAGFILILLSFLVRILWYPITVSDYVYFIAPWFTTLQSSGFSAFAQPFSDYAPMYLYLLKILTFIPTSSLVSEKTLSLIFEIIIAGIAVFTVRRFSAIRYSDAALFLIFAVFLCIPTFLLNSSLWGQSDAVYAAPILASLVCILLDAPLAAALLFGLALSVKVQAIFFAPVLIGYLAKRRATMWYAAIPPIVYAVSILPAAIFGGDFFYWLTVYAKQSGEYLYLSVSSPSIFAFVNNLPLAPLAMSVLFWSGIAIACAVAFAIIVYIKKTPIHHSSMIVLLSLACVLLVPYFLPRMHERYFYLADMLSVLYVFLKPHRWYLPVLIVGASTLAYMPYLSSQVQFLSSVNVDLRFPSILLAIAGILTIVAVCAPHRETAL